MGSSVTFNGIVAPLFYVSPTQINAQVPGGVQSAPQAGVIVTAAGGVSNAFSVAIQSSAIGIFTQDATGCGHLAAFNVHADGSLTLNTPGRAWTHEVPLSLIHYPSIESQYVNVRVHQGGGACVDPPADSLGLITWRN